MKGIIFNMLEEAVQRQFGEATWDALLLEAGLDGVYTSVGNYEDSHLGRLVVAASAKLGLTPDEIVRWAGRSTLPLMLERYPAFFTPHRNLRSFLLTLNTIIHPEVRKLYPGADVPEFTFDSSLPHRLLIEYNSRRQLCLFAEGLIEGAAGHYGQRVALEQTQCMHRGDEKCVIQVNFLDSAAE